MKKRLLTILAKLWEALHASAKAHHVCLALLNDEILHFHDDFVHMLACDIEFLQHKKMQVDLVPLKMSHKMQSCDGFIARVNAILSKKLSRVV